MTVSDNTSNLRNLGSRRSAQDYLAEMWARREFAVALPAETLRASQQDRLLGNVWHLLNPALTVGTYFIVFGGLLGANQTVDNYLLWLTIGVFAYRLTSTTVQRGAGSVTTNRGLMTSFRFPRAILPLSVVISALMTFAFELAVIGVLAVVTGEGIHRRWLVLPLVVVVHSCLNLGVAFVAARAADAFRDVSELIPFAFRLLQYVSGVMFPLERFLTGDEGRHAWLHTFIVYNPLVMILDMYRWVFLGGSIDGVAVLRATAISVLALMLGFRFFRAAEHRYGR